VARRPAGPTVPQEEAPMKDFLGYKAFLLSMSR
jgi:hypothetical protein